MTGVTIAFTPPAARGSGGVHHAEAAAGNESVVAETVSVLHEALDGHAPVERILLKAAAGRRKVVRAAASCHGGGQARVGPVARP